MDLSASQLPAALPSTCGAQCGAAERRRVQALVSRRRFLAYRIPGVLLVVVEYPIPIATNANRTTAVPARSLVPLGLVLAFAALAEARAVVLVLVNEDLSAPFFAVDWRPLAHRQVRARLKVLLPDSAF
ncbi:MAG: hypothetical protein KatS3mg077_2123 [Candidatus Binatia bacterium]|nr:MAG: hypothetical protein KatS3mg077_2123 [Candidatus Binatia bacterium]